MRLEIELRDSDFVCANVAAVRIVEMVIQNVCTGSSWIRHQMLLEMEAISLLTAEVPLRASTDFSITLISLCPSSSWRCSLAAS